jgi:hypothetical protein
LSAFLLFLAGVIGGILAQRPLKVKDDPVMRFFLEMPLKIH